MSLCSFSSSPLMPLLIFWEANKKSMLVNRQSLLSPPSDFRVNNPYGFGVQHVFGNLNLCQTCPSVIASVLHWLLGKTCVAVSSHVLMGREWEAIPPCHCETQSTCWTTEWSRGGDGCNLSCPQKIRFSTWKSDRQIVAKNTNVYPTLFLKQPKKIWFSMRTPRENVPLPRRFVRYPASLSKEG